MSKKRKQGRPRKARDQKLGKQIMVYLTEREFEQIEAEAQSMGLTTSELLAKPFRKGD
jgi:hypothetical protein